MRNCRIAPCGLCCQTELLFKSNSAVVGQRRKNWRLASVNWHNHRSELDSFAEEVWEGRVGGASFWRLFLAHRPSGDIFRWTEGNPEDSRIRERVQEWKGPRTVFVFDTATGHWADARGKLPQDKGVRVVAIVSQPEFEAKARLTRQLVVLFTKQWVASEWGGPLGSSTAKSWR